MKDLKLGVSPLGTIYAGKVLKNGLWAPGKIDVTDMAVSSVAEHLLLTETMLVFDSKGKKYKLSVQEVKESEVNSGN